MRRSNAVRREGGKRIKKFMVGQHTRSGLEIMRHRVRLEMTVRGVALLANSTIVYCVLRLAHGHFELERDE